ncbi:hypothetical protein HDU97_009932 [Phlyctochytrium planicorne]|nr:hypothetical protein HDU97_009932 [Phlyctochytrium planicorne]
MTKELKAHPVVPLHSETSRKYPEVFEALREIRKAALLGVSYFILLGGQFALEQVSCQMILYLTTHAMVDESNMIEISLSNGTIGYLFIVFRKYKYAKFLFEESNQIFNNEDFEDGLTMLEPQAYRSAILSYNFIIINFAFGNIADCLPACQRFLGIGKTFYNSSVLATHIVRLKLIFVETQMGHIHSSATAIIQSLKDVYFEHLSATEGQEIQLCLANHYVALGRFDEAYELYDANAKAIESYMLALAFVPFVTIIPTLLDLTIIQYRDQSFVLPEFKAKLQKLITEIISKMTKTFRGFKPNLMFIYRMRHIFSSISKGPKGLYKAYFYLGEIIKMSEAGEYKFMEAHSRHRFLSRASVLANLLKKTGKEPISSRLSIADYQEAHAGLMAVGMEGEAGMIVF